MRRPWAIAVAIVAAVALSTSAHAGASDTGVIRWRELPALPDPIGFGGPVVGLADDALVVAGGANFPEGRPWDGATKVWHDRVFVLDAPDGQWSAHAARLPKPLAYAVSVTAPDGVVVIGGGDAERHFREVFLIRMEGASLSIEPLPPLALPVAYACGALVDQTIYVAGGQRSPESTEALASFQALDLSQPAGELRWRALESWPGRPRMMATAAAVDGSLYLCGGVDLAPDDDGKAVRTYLTDAHRYRPGAGWRRIADMPRPAAAAPTPGPALGVNGFLVLGGDSGELATKVAEIKDRHPGFKRDILRYDAAANAWSEWGELPRDLGPDPANRPNEGLWPPAVTGAAVWRGMIVVPSGEVRPGVRTPRVLAGEAAE